MNVFFEKYIDGSEYKVGKCLYRRWRDKGKTIGLCNSDRLIDEYGLYKSNFCKKCIIENELKIGCGLIYRERTENIKFKLTQTEINRGLSLEEKKRQSWNKVEYNNYLQWTEKNKIDETSGLNRQSNDKFYTKSDVVKTCIDLLVKTIQISSNDLIIEPSAGSGSFTVELNKLDCDVYSTDLLPDRDDDLIMFDDFFNVRSLLDQDKIEGDIHFVGNPPFGRQSSLAKKFIKECCLYDKCKSISFILPKSFRKDSFKSSFDLKYHLIKEIDLPKNSFQINGINHDVPCVFQIWIKKDNEREVKDVEEPYGFHWVKKPKVHIIDDNTRLNVFEEEPDFGVLRAGGGDSCGRLSEEYLDGISCYQQGWLFIKLDKKYDKESFKEKYKLINFKNDDNVGARSISKPKFNEEINKILRSMD